MSMLKAWIRWLLACAIYYSGIWNLIKERKEKTAKGRRNIILRYHRVNGKASQDPFHLTVSEKMFDAQLNFVKENYKVVSSEELVNTETEHQSGTVAVITFDDGYLDNYTTALPVLKKHGLPATIFMTTDLIESKKRFWWDRVESIFKSATKHSAILNWKEESGEAGHEIMDITSTEGKRRAIQFVEVLGNRISDVEKERLISSLADQLTPGITSAELERETVNWDEVRELAKQGVHIGSHGLSHRLFTKISHAEARREIFESKEKIESELKQPIRYIAYPGGKTSERTWKMAKEAGYLGSFSTEPGENDASTNPYCLRRRAVHENVSKAPWGGFSRAMWALACEGFFERNYGQRPIKIVYVIDKLTRAGSQRHLVQLLKHMDQDVFKIKVICIEQGGPLTEELEALNIPYDIIGVKNWNSLDGLKGFWRLYRSIKTFSPQLVHSYLFTANVFSPLAAKLARVRRVITSRRDLGDWKTDRQLKMNRFGNKFTDLIMINSDAVAEGAAQLEGVSKERMHKIYNGIDQPSKVTTNRAELLKKYKLPGDRNFIGTVCNIRSEKDPMTILKAFARISKKHNNVDLVYAGRVKDEALFEELKKYLAQEKLSERVHFLGSVENVPEVLSLLELFIFGSQSEGFSNSMLEAMAAGLAIVATRIGGNKEQVVEGKTGHLFAKGSDEQCAAAVLRLLESPETLTRMGRTAYARRLEIFNVEQMVQNMIDMYRKQLKACDIEVPLTFEEKERLFERQTHETVQTA